MEIERTLQLTWPTKDMIGALSLGTGAILIASIWRAPVKRAAVANRTRQSRSRLAGGAISSGGYFGRSRKIGSLHLGGVAFFALLAVFPGIAAIVSLYGLFADATTIGKHLSVLSGFFPGGVLRLIAEQITVISRQGSGTLGTSFLVGRFSPLQAQTRARQLSLTLSTWCTMSGRSVAWSGSRHHLLIYASGNHFCDTCHHRRSRAASDLEVRWPGEGDGMASCDPAMANSSRDPDNEPRLHLSLWPEP